MGWAKFDDQYSDHPKVVAAGPYAELLDMRAVIYCARYETDGRVDAGQLPRIAVGIPAAKKKAATLVEVGRWLEVDGGWVVHHFLEYHPSREEQDAKRAEARERMAKNRAKKDRSSQDVHANTQANNERSSPYPDPDPVPEVPAEPTTSAAADPDVSEDARHLTRRFAEKVKANGHAIPKAGTQNRDSWLIDMDRLLRLGPPGEGGHVPDADEVQRVIDWCAADTGNGSYPGEATNIRSVKKFRERYSELRRKALRPGEVTGDRASLIGTGGVA